MIVRLDAYLLGKLAGAWFGSQEIFWRGASLIASSPPENFWAIVIYLCFQLLKH
jgi:hypothetical protein